MSVQRRKALNREHTLKKRYKLNQATFLWLLKTQGNSCNLCKAPIDRSSACIDHSHNTGLVRSLLCRGCNIGLGFVEKRGLAWVRAAEEYLQEHADGLEFVGAMK